MKFSTLTFLLFLGAYAIDDVSSTVPRRLRKHNAVRRHLRKDVSGYKVRTLQAMSMSSEDASSDESSEDNDTTIERKKVRVQATRMSMSSEDGEDVSSEDESSEDNDRMLKKKKNKKQVRVQAMSMSMSSEDGEGASSGDSSYGVSSGDGD